MDSDRLGPVSIMSLSWIVTVACIIGMTALLAKPKWLGISYPIILIGSSAGFAEAYAQNNIPQLVLWGVFMSVNAIGAARWLSGPPVITSLEWENFELRRKLKFARDEQAVDVRLLNGLLEKACTSDNETEKALVFVRDGYREQRDLYRHDYEVEQRKRLIAETTLKALKKEGVPV